MALQAILKLLQNIVTNIEAGAFCLRTKQEHAPCMPDIVGTSPYFRGLPRFDLTNATPGAAWQRFAVENAILGDVLIGDKVYLEAVHNGLPYTDDPDATHFMTALMGDRYWQNVREIPEAYLTRMLGIARSFLHSPPDNDTYERLVSFQTGDPRCHNIPSGKGKHAQTWGNVHLHHLEFSREMVASKFGSLDPRESAKYARQVRAKSEEPLSALTELLARRVVEEAYKSVTSVSTPQYVRRPQHVSPGSITIASASLTDTELARFLQGAHIAYGRAHEEIFSIFVDNYQDIDKPRLLRCKDERLLRAKRHIAGLQSSGLYSDSEIELIRTQLTYLAANARSEERAMAVTTANGKSQQRNDAVKSGHMRHVPWRLPAYSFVFHKSEDNEFATFRPSIFSNGGGLETVGISPIRVTGRVITPEVYDRNHASAARAFAKATGASSPEM